MRVCDPHENLIPSLPKEEVRGVWLAPLARRDFRAAPVKIVGAAFGELIDLAFVEVVGTIDDLLPETPVDSTAAMRRRAEQQCSAAQRRARRRDMCVMYQYGTR